MLGI
jgi:prepilin-type N-terminal cleavage/methylation domain-containing protein